ncbi:MAG TPA: dihydrofolate reductase family protein [Dysgonamonadaceae bacterium]|jgi:dihydrofolate reductase|nr:dihydrofolate reductase family protein [Dysgonamonadaceae bacterium]
MKKIILYIAASIDGYIADTAGTVEWLEDFPITKEMNYGYDDFIASVDTVIMGGSTYREILNMDMIWPYKAQKTYVVTRGWTEKAGIENVEFITDNVIDRIKQLRNNDEKDIFLVGGGKLVAMLLAEGLVDEMQIAYIPVILGKGIPLFPGQPKESKWELTGNTSYSSGILKVDYKKITR